MASLIQSIVFCIWLAPPPDAGMALPVPATAPPVSAPVTARPAPMETAASAAVEPAKAVPGLFGSTEIASKDLSAFTKWSDMWRRSAADRNEIGRADAATAHGVQDSEACGRDKRLTCGRESWEKLVAEAQQRSPMEKLKAVNDYMNRTPYIIDPENWGVPDYWATPREFFLKDGDCEDYAISKYVTLKRLGIDPASMRLVIVQDENLRIAHAVLAVTLGSDVFILDNQVDAVLPQQKILHYRPVYSINETGWWLHQRRRARS